MSNRQGVGSLPRQRQGYKLVDLGPRILLHESSLLAPTSPALYKTQWLAESVDYASLARLPMCAERRSMPLFHDLDELDKIREARWKLPEWDMLEYALLHMQQNQTTLLASDSTQRYHKHEQRKASRPQKPFMMTLPPCGPPRPSLAATHPASYEHRTDYRNPGTNSTEHFRSICSASVPLVMAIHHKSANAALLPCKESASRAPSQHRTPAPATRIRKDSLLYDDSAMLSVTERQVGAEHTREGQLHIPTSSSTTQTPFTSTRGVCADTAHLPLIRAEDPYLSEPRPKHYRCDTDLQCANLVSPVFLTTLPFGSVIETANLYPDERCEVCQRFAMQLGPKCAVHGGEAGTQGYKPHARFDWS